MVDCSDGFIQKDGYIEVGTDQSLGDRFKTTSILTCSTICKLRPDCMSYQFNAKEMVCKLHEIAKPNEKNKDGWTLCVKVWNENKWSKLFCDIDSNLVIMYSDWAMD